MEVKRERHKLKSDREKERERRRLKKKRKKEKNLFTFHVSFCVQTALSNTKKMNYYLARRRGEHGSSIVK